jgi:NTP pyrophosphatase (non-canonical NTP hydrolase)
MTSNQNQVTFDELVHNVTQWAEDRDILHEENAHKQMCKVIEEVGETSRALLKGNFEELKDGIGDSFVTLIILAEQIGFNPKDCLESAWNEIKDRKGKTINGVFIKEN